MSSWRIKATTKCLGDSHPIIAKAMSIAANKFRYTGVISWRLEEACEEGLISRTAYVFSLQADRDYKECWINFIKEEGITLKEANRLYGYPLCLKESRKVYESWCTRPMPWLKTINKRGIAK